MLTEKYFALVLLRVLITAILVCIPQAEEKEHVCSLFIHSRANYLWCHGRRLNAIKRTRVHSNLKVRTTRSGKYVD